MRLRQSSVVWVGRYPRLDANLVTDAVQLCDMASEDIERMSIAAAVT